MYALQKSNRKASARSQIDIKGVKDGILMLSGQRYRMVLAVSSVNFELKSEDEQDAIIETYESFLNSVGCPLEILVRTREIDLDRYLDDLDGRFSGETEAVYQEQLQNYQDFIRGLVATNKILTRHFYVIVPLDGHGKLDFDSVREQLGLRMDIVAKGLARLGIQSRELTSLEILELFYSFYNPEQSKVQPLTQAALELIHTTMVKGGGRE